MSDIINQDRALEALLTETIDRLPMGLGLRAELIQTLRVQRISIREQTERLTTLLELVSAQEAEVSSAGHILHTLAEGLCLLIDREHQLVRQVA